MRIRGSKNIGWGEEQKDAEQNEQLEFLCYYLGNWKLNQVYNAAKEVYVLVINKQFPLITLKQERK